MSRLLCTLDPSIARLLNPGLRQFYTPQRTELSCLSTNDFKLNFGAKAKPALRPGPAFTASRNGWKRKLEPLTSAYSPGRSGLESTSVYSAADSCHFSVENLEAEIALVEKYGGMNSVEDFCRSYDKARHEYKQQTALVPREADLYPHLFRTNLSTYVRNFEVAGSRKSSQQRALRKEQIAVFERCLKLMLSDMLTHEAMSQNSQQISCSDGNTAVVAAGVTTQLSQNFDFQDDITSIYLLNTNPTNGYLKHQAFCSPHPLDLKCNTLTLYASPESSGNTERTSGESDRPRLDELEELKDYYCDQFSRILTSRDHDYRMYDTNLVFVNNWATKSYTTRGMKAYVWQVTKLRAWAHFKFDSKSMRILNVIINEKESTIKIRWRLTGMKNFGVMKNILMSIGNKETREACMTMDRKKLEDTWYDGISVLHVNKDLVIWKHTLEKYEKDNSKVKVPNTVKTKLAAALGLAAATMDEFN